MNDSSALQLPWLAELRELVREHLQRLDREEKQQGPSLDAEIATLQDRLQGYSQSLANPKLPAILRQTIELEYAATLERVQEIESQRSERAAELSLAERIVDEQEILRRLQRLHEILAINNPSMGNLELALHIDKIECWPDGRVRMRTCKLGASLEAIDLLAVESGERPVPERARLPGVHIAKPRRRGRRRSYSDDDASSDARALADFATDPNRFTSLPDAFFWIDEWMVPEKQSWSEEHAIEVWNYWKAVPKRSRAAVSRHFGKSLPTIRRAIRFAEKQLADKGIEARTDVA